MIALNHTDFYRKLARDLPTLLLGNTEHDGYTQKEWTELFKLLNYHGLISFFVHFGGLENFMVNPELKELFHKRAKNIAAANLKKMAVQREVQEMLNKENISFTLLKGLNLSVLLYENPAIRPLIDIDILLEKKDEQKVRKLMEKNGATQSNPLQNTFVQNLGDHEVPLNYNEVIIELHHQLMPGINSINDDSTFEYEINNTTLKTFNPVFYLFYLCYHAQKHLEAGKIKFLWYVDILCLIKKFCATTSQIDEILNLARQYGYEEQIKNTFYIIDEFFKEYFEKRIIPDNVNTEYYQTFKKLISQNKPEIPESYYLKKLNKLNTRNKFRYIMGIFFPSIRYIKARFKLKYTFFAVLVLIINPVRVIIKLLYRLIRKL